MGKTSKPKGNRGEREVADMLTNLIYPDGKGKCVRTPMSGAWKGMSVMTGDILFLKAVDASNDDWETDDSLPLKIEVKRTAKKYSFVLSWLAGEATQLFGFLRQVRENCPLSRVPLVFWRTDFSSWFVIMSRTDFEIFWEWFGILPWDSTTLRVSEPKRKDSLVMMPFADFSKWVDLEVLRGKSL